MVQGDSEAFLESQSKPSFAGLTLKPEAEAHMNGANGAAAGSSSAAAAAAPVANDATEAQTPASAAIAAEEKAPGLLAVAAKSPAAPAPAAAVSAATSDSTAAAATDKAAAEPAAAAAAAAADKPASEKKTVSLFGGYDTNQTNPFQATFTATSGGFGSALASNSNSLFGSSAPGTLTAFTSFASSSGTKWGSPSAAKVCTTSIVMHRNACQLHA
jgi:membrane protein involved in colicin uptake